jgi:hypothetical protein
VKVKLIKIIQDVDNNNHKEERGRFCKDIELIYEPQKDMSITISSKEIFYVEHIRQVATYGFFHLYQYVKISHYHKSDGTYEKIVKDLKSKKWVEDE